MKAKPKLLDVCCKAGGASHGYALAGFEVTGIDIEPQPRYLYKFVQADFRTLSLGYLRQFDVLAGSPPCQAWTTLNKLHGKTYLDLIPDLREMFLATDKPYILENVPTAPLQNYLLLCGTMFNLRLQRHRIFENNFGLVFPPAACCHYLKVVKHGRRPDRAKHFAAVTGHMSDIEYCKEAMGIDWMTQGELAQAIPPAYTRWIGQRVLEHLEISAA